MGPETKTSQTKSQRERERNEMKNWMEFYRQFTFGVHEKHRILVFFFIETENDSILQSQFIHINEERKINLKKKRTKAIHAIFEWCDCIVLIINIIFVFFFFWNVLIDPVLGILIRWNFYVAKIFFYSKWCGVRFGVQRKINLNVYDHGSIVFMINFEENIKFLSF